MYSIKFLFKKTSKLFGILYLQKLYGSTKNTVPVFDKS